MNLRLACPSHAGLRQLAHDVRHALGFVARRRSTALRGWSREISTRPGRARRRRALVQNGHEEEPRAREPRRPRDALPLEPRPRTKLGLVEQLRRERAHLGMHPPRLAQEEPELLRHRL